MSKTKLSFGDVAKDKITGFQGVIVARTRFLSNVDRLSIQPRGLDKEGKPIKPRGFDEGSLEFVETTELEPVPIERAPHPVGLGDTVKDQVTGLVGVVNAITSWFEGCSILQVQPQGLHEGEPIDPAAFDERKVDVVVRANPTPEPVTTGGPRAEPSRGRA